MNIQNIVLFEEDKKSYDGRSIMPLYYRIDRDVVVDRIKSVVKMRKDSVLSFDTYFNSFSCDIWKKYTVIDSVDLSIEFIGNIKVDIYACEIKGNQRLINTVELSEKDRITRIINIPGNEQCGVIYFKITAISDDVRVYGGAYINTKVQKTQKVMISVDICTFKREEYVKRNMSLLKKYIIYNEDSPLYQNIVINISDNGQSLEGIVDTEKFIRVRKNANLGGVGGFTRGIIETKKAMSESDFTHILIMDDDAEISICAMERTFILLSFLKDEYKGYMVGGELLVLNAPYLQYEAGAQWNQGNIRALRHGVDLGEFDNVLQNSFVNERVEYAGWWYCCIPLKEIEDDNLPLPIFIHRDDIEYGLRIGKERFIFMNGICIWHEAFAGKMPGVLEYYDIRNLAITNAIHYPDYSKKQFKKFVLKWTIANIGKYRYKYVELNLKAVKDFCKGIDWIINKDALDLHKELFKMNYKVKPSTDFIGYKNITKDNIKLCEEKDYKLPFYIRLLHWISFNGYFFPDKKNCVHISSPYASVYKLFRVSENLIIDGNGNAVMLKKSKRKFLKCFIELFKIMRLIDREFDNAARSYRTRYNELVSMEFWNRYLGLK